MKLRELLAFAVKKRADEVHLAAGEPVMVKLNGMLQRLNLPSPSAADIEAMVLPLLDEKAKESLKLLGKCEAPLVVPQLGCFRVRLEKGKAVFVHEKEAEVTPAPKKPGFFSRLLGR